MTFSCAISATAAALAVGLEQPFNTTRQRLRAFCWEAEAKAGAKRRAIVAESCFVPLLRWVVSRWQGTQLALALDATTLGDRFVVLAISVVYRGCAIPVAWTILPAGEKHAWRREWLRMVRVQHAHHPCAVDRSGLGRSGPARPLAVSPHRAGGLASLLADQQRRHLPPERRRPLRAVDDLCPAYRDVLV